MVPLKVIRIKLMNIEDGRLLEGGVITISGTDLAGKTNKKGESTVSRVPEGKRTITVTLTNYVNKHLEINFQRGHSVTEIVEMIPVFDVHSVNEFERMEC